MPSMRNIPLECYPLFGMLATGLGFGFYVGGKHLLTDSELRVRKVPVAGLHNTWEERIAAHERKVSEESRKVLTQSTPATESAWKDPRTTEKLSAVSASLSAI